MQFAKTTEYALRALILMARTPHVRYSVRALHERLDLPQKYLGRLMADLGQAGLLRGWRGQNGGYQLARPAAEITVYEVVDLCEGHAAFDRCILGLSECSTTAPCPLHHTLLAQRQALRTALIETSLAALAAGGDTRLRG